MIVAALEAWGRVIERDPEDAEAHAACLTLADGLADADVLLDVLGRALAVEREPARARALARARIRAAIAAPATDPARVDELLEELTSLAGGSEDPRRLALAAEWAARTRRPQILAAALGERAEALAGRPGRATEVVAQRYRAAALWLVADEAARAVQLLGQVLEAQPGLAVAHDLATAARRRLGDLDEVAARTAAPASTAGPDAFARLVRDAELAAARGDGAAASVLLGKALTLRPQDPIAEQPLLRIARHGREAAAVAAIAPGRAAHRRGAGRPARGGRGVRAPGATSTPSCARISAPPWCRGRRRSRPIRTAWPPSAPSSARTWPGRARAGPSWPGCVGSRRRPRRRRPRRPTWSRSASIRPG
jgi:hypothetical protein